MATFIIGAMTLGSFLLVGYKVYKDRKNRVGCSGNCSHCKSMCK